jgi:hypothetical protein
VPILTRASRLGSSPTVDSAATGLGTVSFGVLGLEGVGNAFKKIPPPFGDPASRRCSPVEIKVSHRDRQFCERWYVVQTQPRADAKIAVNDLSVETWQWRAVVPITMASGHSECCAHDKRGGCGADADAETGLLPRKRSITPCAADTQAGLYVIAFPVHLSGQFCDMVRCDCGSAQIVSWRTPATPCGRSMPKLLVLPEPPAPLRIR